MWTTSASLFGNFPLKTTYEAGFVGAPPQRHPPSNSLCLYYTSPENHILTGGTQLTTSPPPTGKTVTQSELFTDDGAAPLKILQSVLSLETILQRVQRGFKEKKQFQKINSRLLMVMGRDVCPWCECQGERLRYPFPECTGEFRIEEQWPKIVPVIWTVRKKSVMSKRPHGWVENFIFESLPSKTITLHRWTKHCERTMKSADGIIFFLHYTDEGYSLPMSAMTAVPQKSWIKATLSVWKILKYGDLLKN